jgi:hypothetical protein
VRLAALVLGLALFVAGSLVLSRPATPTPPSVGGAQNVVPVVLNAGQCNQADVVIVIVDPHAKAGSGADLGGIDTRGLGPAGLQLYDQAKKCGELVKVVNSGTDEVLVVEGNSRPVIPHSWIDPRVCIQPGAPVPSGSSISVGAMCGSSSWGRGTAALLP